MKKVAFVCVHNSCRSQMAEAFGRVMGLNVFESYSAGTEQRDVINQDAVKIMKEIGIDMELNQRPKLLSDIPQVDIVITMGCNVSCPNLPCTHREDWGIEDPTGESEEVFRQTRDVIFQKMEHLVNRLKHNEI
ncbi:MULTISPECIES: arsenate reductase ArsC [Turicibacter]|uniref:Arsenate reductase ArsC n=2 Tax=Turicibacter sanguinis TaxID=154288 RepID=A0A173SP69_9FIRM|nr:MULTISPECIES: arsenate reductase ArsC [Turicibacter]EFF62850.1 low molecular weight phosphotyrosine protein phosphatase [Turicibacter sanguinis PC909]EGC92885.1 low molecular weight phosphotyrosine protein phosphatase [Turicibacter sp. HGF1]MBP3905211.1 arsenate reductase ArsC [Turicibacter sp.]MCU7190172.1 arsenate reductase ArsC [Turicibacter sanguinis]MCU7196067.1 arsenate reductase ArsC [Turicibacter sanguinis]